MKCAKKTNNSVRFCYKGKILTGLKMFQLGASGIAVRPRALIHQLHRALAPVAVVGAEHAPRVDVVAAIADAHEGVLGEREGGGGAVALTPTLAPLALSAPRLALSLATILSPTPALCLLCFPLLPLLWCLKVPAVLSVAAFLALRLGVAVLAFPIGVAVVPARVSAGIVGGRSPRAAVSPVHAGVVAVAAPVEAAHEVTVAANGFAVVKPKKLVGDERSEEKLQDLQCDRVYLFTAS